MDTVCQHSGIQERFEEFLDDNGYSRTYARTKLLEVLMEAPETFLVSDLKESIEKKNLPIGISCIHQNIKILHLFGALEKVVIEDPVDGLVWKYKPTLEKLIES